MAWLNFFKPTAARGALGEFLSHPAPTPQTPLSELPLLAVDMETTGLDTEKDEVLSIGWVAVNGGVIDLGSAGQVYIKRDKAEQVGTSATIHHITDEMLTSLGAAEEEAFGQLLAALEGRALLAHFATIEVGFLSAACKRLYGSPMPRKALPVVDTLNFERRHMERMGTYPRGEDLRLPRVRERYNLPAYSSHNALGDALACAELYLAQSAGLPGQNLKAVQLSY